MGPTYNVALTERQIRALKMLAETIAESNRWSIETKVAHRRMATILENRLARIEAEKGATK